jgi:drug/metabolite transporter (DMT)-like permease
MSADVALSIAVTSLFRALELGPASVVVPIYGMFVVGGFILGVVLLGEAITFQKQSASWPPSPASISSPHEIPKTHVCYGS